MYAYATHGPDILAFLSPQMTEGRHCQVLLLDERKLELLVQVCVFHTCKIHFGSLGPVIIHLCFKTNESRLLEDIKENLVCMLE